MQITEIKIFQVEEEKLKAFVSVVFDQCFMVNDIKIIRGREGLFISMPSRRKRNGRFKDVAHPLNNETRRMIEDEILAEYERKLEGKAPADRVRVQVQRDDFARERPGGQEAEPTGVETDGRDEKTLEEVAEIHLSDSFWTT